MLGTLVVGLGRAGAHLHLPVVRALRANRTATGILAAGPIVAVDPFRAPPTGLADVRVAGSFAAAASMVEPARTVVHLCTPPAVRAGPLAELAALGFRRFIVEKPLAGDEQELELLLALRAEHGLDLVSVGQWRCSELTRRLLALLDGPLGALRTITFHQRKPRFSRTLAEHRPPTAFDVEAPHSLGLVLLLAGPAKVLAAGCADLVVDDAVVPGLGSAWVRLRHTSGVHTEVCTELTAPVRERRVVLECDRGTVVGNFPVSAADEYAHLEVQTADGMTRRVFRDDALSAFLARAYGHFRGTDRLTDEPDWGADVVRLIAAAKRACCALDPGRSPVACR